MMAFINSGKDLAIACNPVNGRVTFDWDDTGNPRFTDSEEHAVFGLLAEFEGQWWADPTGKRGSKLYLLREERGQTGKTIESYVWAALRPLEQQGRITVKSVKASKIGERWWADVRWTRSGAEEIQTTRAPISMEA